MNLRKFSFLLFLILCNTFLFAQKDIDSLNNIIRTANNDTIIAKAYVGLTEIFYTTNPDTVIPVSDKAVNFINQALPKANKSEKRVLLIYKAAAISNKGIVYYGRGDMKNGMDYMHLALKIQQDIDAKLEVATSFNNIGAIYYSQGQTEIALDYFLQGLNMQREIKDEKGMGYSLNNIANIYSNLGQTEKALDFHYQALKINEKLDNKSATASSLNNLAAIYVKLGQKDKGLEYYNKSLEIRNKLGDKLGICVSYNNIGAVYKEMGQTEKALDFYNKSLKMAIAITNKNGIANAFNNIGALYDSRGKTDTALDYYKKGLKYYEEINDQQKISNSLNNIGRSLMFQKKNAEALTYIKQALNIAEKGNNIEGIRNSYLFMARVDSSLGKTDDAFEHYKKYIIYRDSLVNNASRKAGLKKQMQYEYGKKEDIMKAENEKERAVSEEKNRKQQIITWSVLIGLAFVCIFAAFIFRSLTITRNQKKIIEIKNDETEFQKKIIEQKNKDITDSITYAKRIQQAKLPNLADIANTFPESFVLFKPKDIVSGDFYFFHRNAQGMAFIAAADCTGHGVPGALMSMIGSEKLSEAVSQTSAPSKILELLNKGVRTSLRQSDSAESTRDGMDIAFCSVDLENNKVHYAGANRPLWVVRQGTNNIEETKGTKKAIGGLTEDTQCFDSNEIHLNKGDTFYISSDGYADLFNGINGKKLTTKRLKQVILEMQNMSMANQLNHLEKYAADWSVNTEQVDDILIIGIRL